MTRAVRTEILFTDPASVKVVVKDGIVILTGQPGQLGQPDLIPVAVRLTWDSDVVNRLTAPTGSSTGSRLRWCWLITRAAARPGRGHAGCGPVAPAAQRLTTQGTRRRL